MIACPHDVIGYDHEAGRLQAVPPRGRPRPGRLRPRREGVHHLHPGLPALPAAGETPGGRPPVRPPPCRRRGGRRLPGHPPHPGGRRPRSTRSGQDGGLVSAILMWASSTTTSTPPSSPTSRATRPGHVEGGPRRRRHHARRSSRRAGSRYTYSANTLATRPGPREGLQAPRPRRHELPVVGPRGHERPQGREDRPEARVEHRPAVFEDVRWTRSSTSCSKPSTAWQGRHGEDEHQGRVPDLDGRRRLPRDQPEGVPRLDP